MISLKSLKKVHMIGIKGTGMSALALALRSLGIAVTGSDTKDSFLLLDAPRFTRAGIKIAGDFDSKNVPADADAIIASSSHITKNPEVNKARKLKIPVYEYKEIIGALSQAFTSIAVTGSHGKTTTTNLLAYVLQKAKQNIIAVAGPTSPQVLDNMEASVSLLGKAFRSATARESSVAISVEIDNRFAKSDARAFIFEADEYQNKLKFYNPFAVLLTNIELDHPDYFKTQKSYEKVFADFVKRIPADGFLVYCADDPACRAMAKLAKCKLLSYGFSEHADHLIRAVENPENGAPFAIHEKLEAGPSRDLKVRPREVGVFRSALLGRHNILNATAVVLAARELGVSDESIKSSLMSFRGSPRRLQKVSSDPLIFDDYGHHPTEVRATIKALRDTYPDKTIWTVFHPHTFTRTKAFLKEFGDSFADSDHTIVLEIWGSARETQGTVSSRDVVAEIKKHGGKAKYAATFEEAADLLKGKLGDDTLLLTIGAGDVWKLHKLIT